MIDPVERLRVPAGPTLRGPKVQLLKASFRFLHQQEGLHVYPRAIPRFNQHCDQQGDASCDRRRSNIHSRLDCSRPNQLRAVVEHPTIEYARLAHTHVGGTPVYRKEGCRITGPSPANRAITGSYEKDTPGLVGGTYEGSKIGNVSKEVGGVAVNIPIPILAIPGAIVGGISGTTKREIQEFRDALTEDLAQAANQPLTNDKLALGVYGESAERTRPRFKIVCVNHTDSRRYRRDSVCKCQRHNNRSSGQGGNLDHLGRSDTTPLE